MSAINRHRPPLTPEQWMLLHCATPERRKSAIDLSSEAGPTPTPENNQSFTHPPTTGPKEKEPLEKEPLFSVD
jgi:hypothetical protein